MKSAFFLFLILALSLPFFCGCRQEVGLRRATAEERRNYSSTQIAGGELSGNTINLLGNYSFNKMFEDDPAQLIAELTRLFIREPRSGYLTALADVALASGYRVAAADPDVASRYFLNAAMYASAYLGMFDFKPSPYDPECIRMMLIYNSAVSELFSYFCERRLLDKSGFELYGVCGGTVRFEPPQYQLPVPVEQIKKILLCADYRTENLTHISRSFGIGAPLIIDIDKPVSAGQTGFAENQTIPGTFLIKFSGGGPVLGGEYAARMYFIDTSRSEEVEFGNSRLPLEQDFSTPLAYMVKDPPLFNFIEYTRLPGASLPMQGLYRLGPPDDQRIPVVLVHGLLSDTRTWLQMINTLQSDDDIERNYQFLGFSYSSGNPIFHSAWMLRRELRRERERMVAEKRSTEKFDRMVVIGHSMGGLLSRLAVSDSGNVVMESSGNDRYRNAMQRLSPDERAEVEEIVKFKPLPFIKRVIFIAVPHRGSTLAQTWLARLGSSLIQVPAKIIRRNQVLLESMLGKRMAERIGMHITGVDNLDPDSGALKMMNKMKMSPEVKYHSIIGNVEKGGVPGGEDGVVPYSSSHLDGVESEMVVKSGHSAQKAPLAIQEIRRILLEHLKQYPDCRISPPLLLFKKNVSGESTP